MRSSWRVCLCDLSVDSMMVWNYSIYNIGHQQQHNNKNSKKCSKIASTKYLLARKGVPTAIPFSSFPFIPLHRQKILGTAGTHNTHWQEAVNTVGRSNAQYGVVGWRQRTRSVRRYMERKCFSQYVPFDWFVCVRSTFLRMRKFKMKFKALINDCLLCEPNSTKKKRKNGRKRRKGLDFNQFWMKITQRWTNQLRYKFGWRENLLGAF